MKKDKAMNKFSICRRCKQIIEATETGFVAAYCTQCDPDLQTEVSR